MTVRYVNNRRKKLICYKISYLVGYNQLIGDHLNIGLLVLNTLKEENLQEGNCN